MTGSGNLDFDFTLLGVRTFHGAKVNRVDHGLQFSGRSEDNSCFNAVLIYLAFPLLVLLLN